ncbi:MAG: hypothetical protein LBC67_03830 [Spirochaetales bacterium]|jgi:uncharacterized protein YceK|nr:hypothetical protein [Spirochaetales bacterium]
MKRFIVLFAASIIGFSGCASIMSGSRQDVRISSSPENANVVIYDKHNMQVWDGSTPIVANLKRGAGYFSGASYRVEITKKGYEKQTVEISSGLSGWYLAGNIVFGGLIGWIIVDPASGAMWTLEPENVSADLRQSLSFHDNVNDEGIYVVLKEQIPTDTFDSLKLIKVN